MNKELYEQFHKEVGSHNDGVLGYISWLEQKILNRSSDHSELWKDLLRDAMREISNIYYAAGWVFDLEYLLWKIVSEQDITSMNKKDVDKLRILSDLAGGWYYWSDEYTGEVFIPMNEWLSMYGDGK